MTVSKSKILRKAHEIAKKGDASVPYSVRLSKGLKTAWEFRSLVCHVEFKFNGKVYGNADSVHVYINDSKYYLTSKPQLQQAKSMFAEAGASKQFDSVMQVASMR